MTEPQTKTEQLSQTPIKEQAEQSAAEKKTSWQAERKALNDRLERLEAKLAKQGSGETSIQSPPIEKLTTPPTPTQIQAEDHSDHDHTNGKPHYVGPWQKYCPTCGDPNPEFKDEVVCDTCNGNLGAKETAAKLRACPNCGGKKAHLRKN